MESPNIPWEVRVHPVSTKINLFICSFNQMFHFNVKEGLMKLASKVDLANEIALLK